MHSPLIRSLAEQFLARAAAQRWKGAVADDRAVEFFLGAWTGASLVSPKDPAVIGLGMFTTMVLPSRGVKELKKIVQTEEPST